MSVLFNTNIHGSLNLYSVRAVENQQSLDELFGDKNNKRKGTFYKSYNTHLALD